MDNSSQKAAISMAIGIDISDSRLIISPVPHLSRMSVQEDDVGDQCRYLEVRRT
jgi:hypothetical protein